MNFLLGLSAIQRYAAMGLLAALVMSVAANGLLTKAYLSQRDATAQAIESCNTDKAEAIAKAEKIARQAERRAAVERERQLQARLDNAVAAEKNEREARQAANERAGVRERELIEIAEAAFDEDDIPDSFACLNAFVPSAVVGCVLDPEAGTGAGFARSPDRQVCLDTSSIDGLHSGFSGVTYLDTLLLWGRDRDAAIRWNERAIEIQRIQDTVIGDGE